MDTQTAGGEAGFDSAMAGLIAQQSGGEIPPPAAPERSYDREPGGQFKAKEEQEQPKVEAPPKPEEPAKEAEAQEEEDYVELPPEGEGKEPTRFKVSELLAAHKKAGELEQEVTKFKSQPLDNKIEEVLRHNLQARQQYMDGLKQIQEWMAPQRPNMDLINPQSDKYDPATYWQQVQTYQRQAEYQAQAKAEHERVSKEQAEHNGILEQARLQREWTKSLEVWPELKDTAVRGKVVDDVAKTYNFSPDEIKAIADHRVMSVLKDALAYRAGKAAQETAVKVVTAKPKLIKGGARQAQTGKQAAYSQSFEKLSQSHDIQDAVGAIQALL